MYVDDTQEIKKFELSEDFLQQYAGEEPEFGFDGLGKFTFYRTYSRPKDDGSNESFFDVLVRVVNGLYTMQKKHVKKHDLPWDPKKAQRSAQEMFERIWEGKMSPPGRGFWAMGTELTEERGRFEALQNCGFRSTKDIQDDLGLPFAWAMDMLMLGVGIGFDTRGAGAITVPGFNPGSEKFVIPDSREGWVESVRMLIENGLTGSPGIEFDYSEIRERGEPIEGFGGEASGPDPLKKLHQGIREVINRRTGSEITSRDIVDIMNMIGRCVVAGNVRRSAELSLGAPDDEEFLDLKNYDKNPERMDYGWASNNSIFAEVGMDYSDAAERTRLNGEPGYFWQENARRFGRTSEPPDNGDTDILGMNPCCEQPLEDGEMCTLVETYPAHHESLEDYKRTLKFAYLYGKTVTLSRTGWAKTNQVMIKNRRIGTSMTGVQQFVAKRSLEELRQWADEGYETTKYYDKVYSDWLGVPESIRVTTVKPSGTVSLVYGATPGMHWPENKQYIRRVRVDSESELIEPLREAGYHTEPDVNDPTQTVIEFPVSLDEDIRTVDEVSVWEQVAMAAFMQKHWSDNGVSCTVTFDPETEGDQIEHALEHFQYDLKAISFLPQTDDGAYEQMPYEAITREEYEEMSRDLGEIDFSDTLGEEPDVEKYCQGKTCTIDF